MKKWVVMGMDPTGRQIDTTGREFFTRRGALREKRGYDNLGGARTLVPYQGQKVPLVSYVVQEKA